MTDSSKPQDVGTEAAAIESFLGRPGAAAAFKNYLAALSADDEGAELDLLLDRLLARFLRRLEADDFEAWAALDAIFTSHAPSLEWPEVRARLAEYYKSGKSRLFAAPEGEAEGDDQVEG